MNNALQKFFHKTKLSTLMMWSFITLLIVTVIFGMYSYRRSRQVVESLHRRNNENALAYTANMLDRDFWGIEARILDIAAMPTLAELLDLPASPTPADILNMWHVVMMLNESYESGALSSETFVYIGSENSILSAKGKHSAEFFHKEWIKNTGISYEEWLYTITHVGSQFRYHSFNVDSKPAYMAVSLSIPAFTYSASRYPVVITTVVNTGRYNATVEGLLNKTVEAAAVHDRYDSMDFSYGEASHANEFKDEKHTISYTSENRRWDITLFLSRDAAAQELSTQTQFILVILAIEVIVGMILSFILTRSTTSFVKRTVNILPILQNDENELYQLSKFALQMHEESESFREQLHSSQMVVRSNMVFRLLTGDYMFAAQTHEYLEMYDIKFSHPSCLCLCFIVNSHSKVTTREEEMRLSLMRFTVINVMEELLENYFEVYLCETRRKSIGAIVCYDGSEADAIKEIRRHYEYARELIGNEFGGDLMVGIGTTVSDISSIFVSYNEAVTALDLSILDSEKGWYVYSEGYKPNRHVIYSGNQLHTALSNLLRAGDVDGARKVVNNLFYNLQEDVSSALAKAQYFYMIGMMVNTLNLVNIEFGNVVGDIDSISQKILFSSSADEVKELASGVIVELADSMTNERRNHAERLKERIDSAIESNLTSDELCLTFLAEKLGLNANYISNFYKKQTGINIINQINTRRMEQAVKYLNETQLTVNEISAQIGIPNYATFIRLFKKHYGITPGKYRETNSG